MNKIKVILLTGDIIFLALGVTLIVFPDALSSPVIILASKVRVIGIALTVTFGLLLLLILKKL